MDQEFKRLMTGVEDAFGFVIPEADANQLHTAGELYDYILTHRFAGNLDSCLYSIVFYKIRRGLMWALKIDRDEIHVAKPIASLMPRHRHGAWQALQRAIGLRLPFLRRPAWVMTGAFLATLATAVAVPWSLSLGLFNGALLACLLTAFVAAHGFAWMTEPLAIELQPDCTTVGELVSATLARNYRAIVDEASRPMSSFTAWNLVRTLVAEHGGHASRNITRETDLRRSLIAV
jgi:hypothetical protein